MRPARTPWWVGGSRSPSSAPGPTPWSAGSRGSPTTPAAALPPLLVVAGATATGKTALALELAERLRDVEVVSADSRQVYRGMDIGTAKAGAADRARVPHHGLDLVDPDQGFTAADYLAHARSVLLGIAARGRVALLVGGTGLYLRAVAAGLPLDETGADPAVRAALEARLAASGLAELVAELRERAPGVAARTDLANPRRVVRALERATVAGDQPPPAARGYGGPVLWLGLRTERAAHERAIAERARAQFDAGLVGEAATLRARFGAGHRAFSAMGYREAFALLDGHLDREGAIARDAARTRAYARRQETWFRAERAIVWLPDGPDRPARALELVHRHLLGPTMGTMPGPDALS